MNSQTELIPKNNTKHNTSSNIKKIWRLMPARLKKKLVSIIFVSLICGFFELIALGIVFPYIAFLNNPTLFYESDFVVYLRINNMLTMREFLLVSSGLVILLSILSSVVKTRSLFLNSRFSAILGNHFGQVIFNGIISQPYESFLQNKSYDNLGLLSNCIDKTTRAFKALLQAFTAVASITGILICLLFASPFVSLLVFAILSLLYVFIFKLSKNKVAQRSELIKNLIGKQIKLIQESIGGYRDIYLRQNQYIFNNQYSNLDVHRSLQVKNDLISRVPRYVFESLCITVLVLVVFVL